MADVASDTNVDAVSASEAVSTAGAGPTAELTTVVKKGDLLFPFSLHLRLDTPLL
jgi:hypothetical protein